MTQGLPTEDDPEADESTLRSPTDPPDSGLRGATVGLTPPPDGDGGGTSWLSPPTPPDTPPGSTRPASDIPEPLTDDEALAGAEQLVGQPEPGQVLFDRYLVVRLIGEGGMGSVWLVRHLELDAPRALKLIVATNAFNPDAQARFRREARVMAKLTHPHAVIVHDARIARAAAYIEMEYVRGASLNRLLKPGVPMPLDWTARVLGQLCDVLQEAHDHGIVHRDLKPSNLMLLDGRPPGREHLKVLDFGIAKVLSPEQEAGLHTETGVFLGTAQYSSPEQARGEDVDRRSDLYAVGVILYEFLTGRRPFDGPMISQLHAHQFTPPPPFSDRNPSAVLPSAVERVVMRCLAKDPNLRPQTARALAEAFHEALGARPGVWSVRPPSLNESALFPATAEEPPSLAVTEGADPAGLPSTLMDATWGPGIVDRPRPKKEPVPELATGLPTAVAKAPARPRVPWKWLALALGLVGVAALAVILLTFRRPAAHQLPAGFVAEKPDDLVNGWPRAIVRTVGDHQIRFVRIEGGTFLMGDVEDQLALSPDELDERLRLAANGQMRPVRKYSDIGSDDDRPAHAVRLSDYYMQQYEVTNGEIKAYLLQETKSAGQWPARWRAAYETLKNWPRDADVYPAVGVPHALAVAYARWVGGKLPTEAQWEYAARSRGKLNLYVWGNERGQAKTNANLDSIEVGPIGKIYTDRVDEFRHDRSEQGICGLMGNVREWCRDRWAPYHDTGGIELDPEVPASLGEKPADLVIRGGSFAWWSDKTFTTRPRRPDPTDPQELTTQQLAEDQTADDLGFRVVIEWPPRR